LFRESGGIRRAFAFKRVTVFPAQPRQGVSNVNRNHLAPLTGLLLAAGCADGGPVATEPAHQPFWQANVIASTEPVFAFLSPLGDASPPAGVFDALAAPVAQICSYAGAAWSEADCAAPIEEWTVDGKGPRKLALVGEAYEATWRTKANQNQSLTYRIRVLVGGVEVGFNDAGYDPAKAGPGYYVLTRREALPIRFWIGTADEPEPEPEPDVSVTSSPNFPLIDGGGIPDEIVLAGSGCAAIQGIKVRMDIAHPMISDLFVRLHHLTEIGLTTVILHERSGESADLIGTYPDDLTPVESLDALLGQVADGRWILTVEDAVENSNAGTLREWGLDIWCAAP
jgi:subtilisin-like proprotein convertase family protein